MTTDRTPFIATTVPEAQVDAIARTLEAVAVAVDAVCDSVAEFGLVHAGDADAEADLWMVAGEVYSNLYEDLGAKLRWLERRLSQAPR